jgi:hypothetical protein
MLRVGVSHQICVLKRNAKFLDLEKVVTPVKTGVQVFQGVLDPGFRRGDDPKDFLRDHQNCKMRNILAF